ncbi:MAG: DsbA family protein [Anaerolineae bacterium]|nr:DsbA family protein [Anaerolineae bacterium]NUQ02717.1 thioredoxin domain-containing protein [Anaerolineae bacterium]
MAQQRRNRKTDSKPEQSAQPSRPTASGSRAAERIRERERERQRRRLIMIVGTVVGLAVLFAVIFILVNLPQEAPIPQATTARYADLPVSRTQEGYPLLGEPNASVKVSLYSSFDCPSCRDLHDQIIDELVTRVRDEKIAVIYVPLFGYGTVPNGQGAAIAAVCAAEQQAFWQFHDMLFDWQGRYGNQSFTNNRLVAGLDALGLNRGQHSACVASGSVQELLTTARNNALALLSFNGAPTVAINGVVPLSEEQTALTAAADILAAIDAEIERVSAIEPIPEATAEPESAPALESTPEATAEPAGAAVPESTPESTPEATTEAAAEAGG